MCVCVCLEPRKDINLEIHRDVIPLTQLFIGVFLLVLFRKMFRSTLITFGPLSKLESTHVQLC
jgi:hypothetical protein